MTFKYKILSIDGGGIRGIIPAMLLAEIEKRTGKQIFEMFDLIAGTSTGGLLALALTLPDRDNPSQAKYQAKDTIELYKQEGKIIFKKDDSHLEKWIENSFKPIVQKIGLPVVEIEDLLRPKFPSDGRDKVLTKYFGDTFIEKALKEVVITSYDTELRSPVFFTSNPSKQVTDSRVFRKICSGFTMKQAAMATSAAPTYFEPYKVPTAHPTERGYYSLVDGGVFANNPTSLAVMEIIIESKKAGKEVKLEDILVVSLGTGSLTRRYAYEQAKNWGLVGWVEPLVNIMMDGQSESVAVQLEQLLPSATDRPRQYYRFQQFLDDASDDMDNVTPANIEKLQELAGQIITQNKPYLDALCQQLV